MFKRSVQILLALGLIITSAGSILFAADKINSSALSHYIAGVVYDDLGDLDKAIEEYKKALSIDNGASVIRLNLATSLIKKNDLAAAEKELKRVVRLEPDATEPHAILAILYSIQNKVDLAISEYEGALKCASKLNPKDIEIYQGLGSLYLKQNKLKEAENTYRIISSLAPLDPKVHFYLGVVYEELKNYDLCEKELKEALRLNPDYSEALNFLGYEYVEWNKDLNQAEGMIKKALSLDQNNGAYIDSLGWLYFKSGKVKKAKQLLEKAASLMQDPVIYDHLGDACFKLKEINQAKSNWQKSLQLDPKQETVKKKIEALNKNAGNAKSN